MASRLGKNARAQGETRNLILQSIELKPKTVLELMLELNTNASTMRRHLKELDRQGLVEIVGKDKKAFKRVLGQPIYGKQKQ